MVHYVLLLAEHKTKLAVDDTIQLVTNTCYFSVIIMLWCACMFQIHT